MNTEILYEVEQLGLSFDYLLLIEHQKVFEQILTHMSLLMALSARNFKYNMILYFPYTSLCYWKHPALDISCCVENLYAIQCDFVVVVQSSAVFYTCVGNYTDVKKPLNNLGDQ